MLEKRQHKTMIATYLAVEVVLFLVVLLCEACSLGLATSVSKYLSVLAAALLAACVYVRRRSTVAHRRSDLVALGLCVTAVADWFLTLIGSEPFYIPGIALFCVVQTIYFLYLGVRVFAVAVRMALFFSLLAGPLAAMESQPAVVLGALDLVLLLCNVVQAWMTKNPQVSLLFKLGITLFLCCDATLGVQYLGPASIQPVAAFMVWNFYLPAQMLIALSYVRDKKADDA